MPERYTCLPMTAIAIWAKRILGVIAALNAVLCTAQPGKTGATLAPVIAREMARKPGTVVVMEVASGRIIAQWNPKVAALRVAAPGSTIKPFVLLELLRLGKLDPEQHLVCRRQLRIDGRHMDCTHSAVVTDLDAADAVAYSCNTYFADVAKRLGREELLDGLARAGFASTTGLAKDEAVGRLSLASDPEHLQLQALGYWGIEVTPLELLAAYRSLALHKLRDDLPQASPVFEGLEHAVQYGMAHEAEARGLTAAGKTGTAASDAKRPVHGFFVGYAPAERPVIAVVVYLEHGRGSDAAALAAPIFTAYGRARHDTVAGR